MHPAAPFRGYEDVTSSRDQIEYSEEEPWIRQKFAEELAKRGTQSKMPEEAYTNPDYQWSFKKAAYSAPGE